MSGESFSDFLGFGNDTATQSTGANNPGAGPKDQKDKQNNPDRNRVDNRANAGRTERLVAEFTIVGMPHIKARKCITIANVGQWSGDWYVKSVKHSWSSEKGYITHMSLLREVA